MQAADWFYVGLSILMQVVGLTILAYAFAVEQFGWRPRGSFLILAFYAGAAISLLGLHGVGLLWQLPHRPFTRPMPVFVFLCLDVLVAAALLLMPILHWLR